MPDIEFKDNSTTSEAPETVEATEPVEQTTEETPETAPTDNSTSKEQKNALRKKDYKELYDKSQKSYEELRSLNDRRFNEMQKKLEFFSPYEQALKKALDEKKQAEMQGLYQQNPLEAQRRMAEEIAQQKMAPYQQQMESLMMEKQLGNTIEYLQTTYGQEAFNTLRGPMSEILNRTTQTQGQEVSNLLAQNPDALFKMALGEQFLAEVKNNNQAKQVGTANQNKAVQFAKGTAKPVGNSKGTTTGYENMSDKELEALAYEQLAKLNR